jgi:hypothetical protein
MGSRSSAAYAAIALLVCVAISPAAIGAQQWNDQRTLELVGRATERRALQLADTALEDYRARAHGYLTFLAQLGAGFPEPPKIVKADELALDVYWRAPDLSKQLIVGRRDTLLLPTDIEYHRDHLGIVQGNFPEIIRLGDGDEVRDVPHPVSPAGLQQYDFAISDSLQLRAGPRTIDVIEVRVRPRDDRAARVVGAVYIERETADLVRMAFGFTRAALRDRSLEDLSVVLENGLIDGRFWLPRRQEIEIRRTGTWLDYPVRTIIRGRWEICCHVVNTGISPAFFAGPEIVLGPRVQQVPEDGDARLGAGPILEALRDEASPASDAEVRRVQEEARALVRAQALARAPTPALAGTRLSDFISFNRVEGLALGAGIGQRVGLGFAAMLQGRYGFADDRWKGKGELSWTRASGFVVQAGWRDAYADASDVQEVSLARNSIAAQEFGSDYTEPYAARGPSLALVVPAGAGRFVLSAADERHRALSVNAVSARGSFAPTLAVPDGRVRRLALRWERPTQLVGERTRIRYSSELALMRYAPDLAPPARYARAAADAHMERAISGRELVVEVFAAATGGGLLTAPQHYVLLGGPVSAPGYEYHSIAGRRAGFARVELRSRVPFPSIPLGRFGATPRTATLAPFFSVAVVGAPAPFRTTRSGGYPSLGVGLLPFFDLLRLDLARGLRDGRWALYLDVTPDFWPVL